MSVDDLEVDSENNGAVLLDLLSVHIDSFDWHLVR